MSTPPKLQDQIVAIKVLNGCDPSLKKNLKEGEYYYLNKVVDLKTMKIISDLPRLYDYSQPDGREITINISAIVGGNGSGKSTIVELVIAFLYSISVQKDILDGDQSFKDFHLEVIYVKDNKLIKLVGKGFNVSRYECDLDETELSFKKVKGYVKIDDFPYHVVTNYSLYGLNSSEIGEWIDKMFHKNDGYQVPCVLTPHREDGNIDVNKESELTKDRMLLNGLSLGTDKSNFQIVSDKVVKNIRYTVNDKKFTSYGDYKNNYPVFKVMMFEQLEGVGDYYDTEDVIGGALLELLGLDKGLLDGHSLGNALNKIKSYIFQKVIKICATYKQYGSFVCCYRQIKRDQDEDISVVMSKHLIQYELNYDERKLGDFHYLCDVDVAKLGEALKSDHSHITTKLHRAINFVKYHDKDYYRDINEIASSIDQYGDFISPVYSFPIEKFRKNFKLLIEDKGVDITEESYSEFFYPSFLDVDFELVDKEPKEEENKNLKEKKNKDLKKEKNKSPFWFNTLSSGEKQKIYSINNLLYHARNIDSVSRTEKGEEEILKTYDSVTFILDEIELYFHPEMQRTYIDDLIKTLSGHNFKNIKNFNITFITHSPYILSDIPSQFILKLKNGIIQDDVINSSNSFAGNIHNMLAQDFFMSDSIGEFARNKIDEIVEFYYKVKRDKQDKKDLDELKQDYKTKRTDFVQTVGLIGERAVKNILKSQINSLERILYADDPAAEIELLKERIDQLNKKPNA
ncbi:hypothetical protein K5X82_01785 [Halosquirtibacter xylanolyticus]|uniref:hypothetical protein n=1 Tax=Halosquirtibacter xylanolyticus TaxID=3374599 RepID=UPI003747DE99|nr:hypothetical protein K5X82_01785 [Prolixibacteraceae bacterium]